MFDLALIFDDNESVINDIISEIGVFNDVEVCQSAFPTISIKSIQQHDDEDLPLKKHKIKISLHKHELFTEKASELFEDIKAIHKKASNFLVFNEAPIKVGLDSYTINIDKRDLIDNVHYQRFKTFVSDLDTPALLILPTLNAIDYYIYGMNL